MTNSIATTTEPDTQQAHLIALQGRNLENDRPYFDAAQLPASQSAYVCWLDLLGAGNAMKLSLPRAANFIGKIHVTGIRAANSAQGVTLYPVIDGFYAVSQQQQPMLRFLRAALRSLSITFLFEQDNYKRFMVRSGLAFGPILQGVDLSACSNDLNQSPTYSGAVALGQSISQAYESERLAAPFGVYVHESARVSSPPNNPPLPVSFWKWCKDSDATDILLRTAMAKELEAYLAWADEHRTSILFPTDEKPDFGAKLLRKVREYFQ